MTFYKNFDQKRLQLYLESLKMYEDSAVSAILRAYNAKTLEKRVEYLKEALLYFDDEPYD